MVPIMALWLPMLVSAVIVYIASSVVHMVLTHHRSDYRKLANENRVLDALRGENLTPGNYLFPHAGTPKNMRSPEMVEKYKRGPVGILTMLPSGPPAMTKNLVQWFVFCLAVGVFVAYVTGRTLAPGASYLAVFRIAGTVAFLGYAGSRASDAIWFGQPWSSTVKHIIDGFVYALLTAGVFAWRWPDM
ncbi:MAG: hypothetical protein ACREMV_12145 [Gemmatimonadales bacterium]